MWANPQALEAGENAAFGKKRELCEAAPRTANLAASRFLLHIKFRGCLERKNGANATGKSTGPKFAAPGLGSYSDSSCARCRPEGAELLVLAASRAPFARALGGRPEEPGWDPGSLPYIKQAGEVLIPDSSHHG